MCWEGRKEGKKLISRMVKAGEEGMLVVRATSSRPRGSASESYMLPGWVHLRLTVLVRLGSRLVTREKLFKERLLLMLH